MTSVIEHQIDNDEDIIIDYGLDSTGYLFNRRKASKPNIVWYEDQNGNQNIRIKVYQKWTYF